jgi:two-component system sensor histidine kinase QseC
VPVNLCDVARAAASDIARGAAGDTGGGGAGDTGGGAAGDTGGGAARPPIEVAAPDEVLVRGSEELLERALANLLENAAKYAGPAARVRVEVTAEDGEARISVDDSGPGIPPALRPRVFERFVRGNQPNEAPRSGAGLGLAVVQAIARRHGGSASTGPSPLGGERVTIRLPLLR